MPSLIRTARWTGGAYLALAVLGGLGFLLVRPLATEALGYAQIGIALELGVVITQSLAAVGFFALYREDRPVAAYAVAAFGMGNALAVLGSAAMLTAALAISLDPASSRMRSGRSARCSSGCGSFRWGGSRSRPDGCRESSAGSSWRVGRGTW